MKCNRVGFDNWDEVIDTCFACQCPEGRTVASGKSSVRDESKSRHAQVSWQLLRQFKSLGFRLQFFNFAHRIGQFLN